jgi:raffinose/stachyose/melibiose transport system permease protein
LGFFSLFLLVPVLAALGLAFTSWTGFDLSQIAWAGADNFRELGDDDVFPKAFRNTLIFVVATTVLLNALGLAAALAINSRVRGHELLRIAMFLPLGLAPVITGIMWQQLLGPYGLINRLVTDVLPVRDGPIQFLGDPELAFLTIILAAVWQYSALNMLLIYAGLQSLPQDRMEAAAIDGAGPLSRVRWVVVPYLRPVFAVAIVLNLIGGWKVFDLVYVLTSGGPNRATEVLSTHLYQQAFQFNALGYASVLGAIICVLAVASALVRGPIAGRSFA